jgi:hypothetical protein
MSYMLAYSCKSIFVGEDQAGFVQVGKQGDLPLSCLPLASEAPPKVAILATHYPGTELAIVQKFRRNNNDCLDRC